MAWDSTKPAAGDILSTSQGDIQGNFAALVAATSPTHKRIVITTADADNVQSLTVDQNDVTNNPICCDFTNAGTNHGLYLNQTGVLASAKNALYVGSPETIDLVNANSALVFIQKHGDGCTEPAVEIDSDSGTGLEIVANSGATYAGILLDMGSIGHGLHIKDQGNRNASNYALFVDGNYITQTNSDLVFFRNVYSTPGATRVLRLENDGTGDNLFIDQDGNGIALNIDSEVADDGMAVDIAVAGTSPQNVSIYRCDDVTGNVVLRLGSGYIWVDATGDLRIHTALPTSDTGGTVVGSQS